MKKKQWRPFEEAREFVQKLGLKDGKDYKRYYESGKVPDDIPKCPWAVYSKEWKGMGDFLGTGFVAAKYKKFRPFTETRKFVRKLGLKNLAEWRKYCKLAEKPDDIPSDPAGVYKNKGWKNLGDWLGTGMIAYQNREYKSFEDARKFVRSLKLKSILLYSFLAY